MVDGNCRFKPRWVTFSSGSEPDVLSIWRSLVKSLLWRNQSWPVLSSAGNMASTAAFPNTSSHVHQNTVKTYSDRKFQCLRIEERFFFSSFSYPTSSLAPPFFFVMLNFTLKSELVATAQKPGKTLTDSNIHTFSPTHTIPGLAAGFWPSCPLLLQKGTIYKMGPALFGRCLICYVFFFPQRLSAEIRGFKVLSYIPLKGLPICSQVISGKQSCVPRLDEAKACYSHSAASLPAEKCC